MPGLTALRDPGEGAAEDHLLPLVAALVGGGGVGHGVALPHARSTDVEKVCGVFILLESPVDFGSVDKLPVDIIFGLLAPENAGVDHLKALAIVSRTLRDNSICAKLRANPEPQTLYTILTENQNIQAA